MATNEKEIWKPISYLTGSERKKYAVSNTGKIASYENDINDRRVLKINDSGKYPRYLITDRGHDKSFFPHHAVARMFLKQPSPKHKFVIHLDYNKLNNHISNLKWATPKEQAEHKVKNPSYIKYFKTKLHHGVTARKLNEKKVIQLKKEIWNPERKLSLKQLADKYGIAEMNLYRIKAGILWFHVHVEGEPIHERYKQQLKNIEYHKKLEEKEAIITAKKQALKKEKIKQREARLKKLEAEKKIKLAKRLAKKKEKEGLRKAIEKRKAERLKKAAEKLAQKEAKASKRKLKTKGSKLENKKSKKKDKKAKGNSKKNKKSKNKK